MAASGVRNRRFMRDDRTVKRSHLLAAAAVVLILAIWALWPSRYARVKNLGSRGTNVIAFGDSLTAGYGAGAGEDYPSALSRMIGVTVTNAGVSGDTSEAALARLDADIVAHDARVVIVGLGGNDFLQSVPIATTGANLRVVVRGVQHAGAVVVVLGFRFPSVPASYEKMYSRVAAEE